MYQSTSLFLPFVSGSPDQAAPAVPHWIGGGCLGLGDRVFEGKINVNPVFLPVIAG